MLVRALRVASRFLEAQEVAEEAASGSSKGRAPARWNEWLDAAHQGGKEKVRNPNPSSSKAFPQVSYSTALKHKPFYEKAKQEYLKWLEDQKEDGKGKKPKKEAEPEKPTPKLSFGVTPEEVEALSEKYAKDFDEIIESGKKEIQDFNYQHKGEKSPIAQREWQSLSENEKLLHVIGHRIGKKFEQSLEGRDKDVHDRFYDQWRESSGSRTAHEMMGTLKALGVKGSLPKKEVEGWESDDVKWAREKGATSDANKEYARKAYLYQQAFFKRLGVTELTLYRGVQGQGVESSPPQDGDPVQVQTRELSSFSTDPHVAIGFGRILKFKVPVGQVFGSNLVRPEIGSDVNDPPSWSEAEIVVMGAEDLVGECAQRTLTDEKPEKDKSKKPEKGESTEQADIKQGKYKGKLHKEINADTWKEVEDLWTSDPKEAESKYSAIVMDYAANNSLETLKAEHDKIHQVYLTESKKPGFSDEEGDGAKLNALWTLLEGAVSKKTHMMKQAAAKKPFVVKVDEKNEDWLQERRKLLKKDKKDKGKEKDKKAMAVRVAHAFLKRSG